MTFGGVPILDWVLLVVLLGLGVEAWITARPPVAPKHDVSPQPVEDSDPRQDSIRR